MIQDQRTELKCQISCYEASCRVASMVLGHPFMENSADSFKKVSTVASNISNNTQVFNIISKINFDSSDVDW